MSLPADSVPPPSASWPFAPGAFAVARPCGCVWIRLGQGVGVMPCAAHGANMAETVRQEEAARGNTVSSGVLHA